MYTAITWSVRLVIALLLLFFLGVVAYFADWAYRTLREKRVRAVYDAQHVVVDDAIKAFVEILEQEGLRVQNEPYRQGGSGEWRTTAVIVTKNADGESSRCQVEVQGFVSHNAADQPIWTKNLPMTIKGRGYKLDSRFIEILVALIEKRGWEYEIK